MNIQAGKQLTSQLKTIVQNKFIKHEIEKLQARMRNAKQNELYLIKNILGLLNIFVQQLEQTSIYYIKKYNNYGSKGTMRADATIKEQELMVYGAQLIYSLRSFLLSNQQLYFNYGVKDTKTGQTKSIIISQSELLPNLQAVGNNSIGIYMSTLQKQFKMTFTPTSSTNNKQNEWNQVDYLSEFYYTKKARKIAFGMTNNNQIAWAYQNQKMDNYIYGKFVGKNKINLYYDIGGKGNIKDFQFFNKGWLWEWYNNIYNNSSDTEYQYVSQSLNRGIIRPIIQQTDTIRGTKQGDYIDAAGRQIQAKYNNEKLISYNNIRVVIFQLQTDLKRYIEAYEKGTSKEVTSAKQKLQKHLDLHFAPDATSVAERVVTDSVNQMLNNLNIK